MGDGVPGLTFSHRNKTWTSIEPSPVASRLRTKPIKLNTLSYVAIVN